MKVFDLQCGLGHGFEGWFAAEDDFRQQCDSGLLACPVCGDARVVKLPSAPRLNLKAQASTVPEVARGMAAADGASAAGLRDDARFSDVRAQWLQVVRAVMAETQDVGAAFAQEARRIHDGEAPDRAIRGKASAADVVDLLSDGIDVLPLPVPPDFDGNLQ